MPCAMHLESVSGSSGALCSTSRAHPSERARENHWGRRGRCGGGCITLTICIGERQVVKRHKSEEHDAEELVLFYTRTWAPSTVCFRSQRRTYTPATPALNLPEDASQGARRALAPRGDTCVVCLPSSRQPLTSVTLRLPVVSPPEHAVSLRACGGGDGSGRGGSGSGGSADAEARLIVSCRCDGC